MKNILSIIVLFLLAVNVFSDGLEQLQNQNVLVKNEDGAGSGVIITKNIGGDNVSFVITAAHIVDTSRVVKRVVESNKNVVEKIEFKDVVVKMEKLSEFNDSDIEVCLTFAKIGFEKLSTGDYAVWRKE